MQALDAFEQARHHDRPNDATSTRVATAGVMAGKGLVLLEPNRREDAIDTLEQVADYVHVADRTPFA